MVEKIIGVEYMSKHEDIIKYVRGLKVGSKISVRTIATDLSVSEGTAYRAIKDAEALGLLSTIPRVGTVRIEKLEKKHIESLTFSEVVNIIGGSILGGRDGLYKALNKFVIGAMTIDVMERYISPGNLLIAGNREEVHRLALENQCAVLITGGFGCTEEIKALANEKQLPIISCSYDTFTTATMINKVISENLIKKDIILVEDIMVTNATVVRADDKISYVRELTRKTGHGKFPVLDENDKIVGIITSKDYAIEISDDEIVSKIMSKEPIIVQPKSSVAYAAHVMIWEGIELMSVVDDKKLLGVVSRQDVIKALQYLNGQPQMADTIDDIILKNFTYLDTNSGIRFRGKIAPQMLNTMGTASWNALTLMMSTAGTYALRQRNHLNVAVESFTVMYTRPIQIDSIVIIEAEIIAIGRNFAKIEIEMISEEDKGLIAKGLLGTRILRK